MTEEKQPVKAEKKQPKSIWEKIVGKTKEAKIRLIEMAIKTTDDLLEKLDARIQKANQRWTEGYHRYNKAAKELAILKIHGTKKEDRLKEIILEWNEATGKQTDAKKSIRNERDMKKEERHRLEIELGKIKAELDAEERTNAEIVEQVFNLHGMVLKTLKDRNDYLSAKVYHRLLDENGNLRSQITIDHPDGTKRVVALVNSITKILPEMAIEAKAEIDKFFQRFQKLEDLSPDSKALYDLVQQLLIEKTSFKVGTELYRFLDLTIDEAVFPELKKAQSLLRRSLRSEKTESYVRLYTRKSRADKWQPVGLE